MGDAHRGHRDADRRLGDTDGEDRAPDRQLERREREHRRHDAHARRLPTCGFQNAAQASPPKLQFRSQACLMRPTVPAPAAPIGVACLETVTRWGTARLLEDAGFGALATTSADARDEFAVARKIIASDSGIKLFFSPAIRAGDRPWTN